MTRNTITLPRSVVEQALEAFEDHAKQYPHMQKGYTVDAANALRAALEQSQTEQELPSKSDNYLNGYCTGRTDLLREQTVEQKPVAWIENIGGGIGYNPYHDAARKLPDGVRFDLYTHPQNLNCKSNQARLATLWGYIKEQPQQEQEWKRRLGNLLAVIHGDGGHYIEAHGWDKAQADAEERVARVMTGLPQSASVVWPRTASEVRAFLSGHVAAERYARDDHQPDDSDTYTLSAHDLLGAIDWWTDCAQRPRQPLTPEAVNDLWIKHARSGAYIHAFARAIERAHGIGGEA